MHVNPDDGIQKKKIVKTIILKGTYIICAIILYIYY